MHSNSVTKCHTCKQFEQLNTTEKALTKLLSLLEYCMKLQYSDNSKMEKNPVNLIHFIHKTALLGTPKVTSPIYYVVTV